MTLIFTETFENGGVLGGSGFDGRYSVGTNAKVEDNESANPKNGSYALRAHIESNTAYAEYYKAWSSGNELWAQFWVYISDLPDTGEFYRLMMLSQVNSGTGQCYFGIYNDGGTAKWMVRGKDGAVWTTYLSVGATPVVDTWYEVRCGVVVNASTGAYYLKIDQTSHVSETSLDTTDTPIYYFCIGLSLSDAPSTNVDIDIDDVNVATDESDLSWYEEPGYIHEAYHEDNDLLEYDDTTISASETIAASSTRAKNGTYSAKGTTNGDGGSENAYAEFQPSPTLEELYARAYFYVDTHGIVDDADNIWFIRFRNAANYLLSVGIRRVSGTIEWVMQGRNGASYILNQTEDFTETGWICVECYWLNHATAGIFRLYVDGVQVYERTAQDTADYGNCDEVSFGIMSTDIAASIIYWDDAFVDDSYIGTDPSRAARASSLAKILGVVM